MNARMSSRVDPPQCPVCRCPPGPDCPVRGRNGRQVRRIEKRELATEPVGERC